MSTIKLFLACLGRAFIKAGNKLIEAGDTGRREHSISSPKRKIGRFWRGARDRDGSGQYAEFDLVEVSVTELGFVADGVSLGEIIRCASTYGLVLVGSDTAQGLCIYPPSVYRCGMKTSAIIATESGRYSVVRDTKERVLDHSVLGRMDGLYNLDSLFIFRVLDNTRLHA